MNETTNTFTNQGPAPEVQNLRIVPNVIFKEQLIKTGRFTIVTVTNDEPQDEHYGLRGVGISRCSEIDGFKDAVGFNIARGRAIKAYFKKKNKRQLRNWYEG